MYNTDSFAMGWVTGILVMFFALTMFDAVDDATFYHKFFVFVIAVLMTVGGRFVAKWIGKVRE